MPVLWFYVCIQLLVHTARGQRGTGSQTGFLSSQLGTEQTASQLDQSRNSFIRLGTEQATAQLDQSRKLFILPSRPQ